MLKGLSERVNDLQQEVQQLPSTDIFPLRYTSKPARSSTSRSNSRCRQKAKMGRSWQKRFRSANSKART
jgi:hypothetical protein